MSLFSLPSLPLSLLSLSVSLLSLYLSLSLSLSSLSSLSLSLSLSLLSLPLSLSHTTGTFLNSPENQDGIINNTLNVISILLIIRMSKLIGTDRDSIIAEKVQAAATEFPVSLNLYLSFSVFLSLSFTCLPRPLSPSLRLFVFRFIS
jgi:hypothetical protein